MRHILLVGNCGSGKTWVMKQLLARGVDEPIAVGYIKGLRTGKHVILGVYDNSTFEGSDRLSMAVASHFKLLSSVMKEQGWYVIAEGDRFTNSKFTEAFNPYVIKITDDGEAGRTARGSQQSGRQLKAIETRVRNFRADEEVADSTTALERILELTKGESDG